MEPLKVINRVPIVLRLADLWNPQILNYFLFCHSVRKNDIGTTFLKRIMIIQSSMIGFIDQGIVVEGSHSVFSPIRYGIDVDGELMRVIPAELRDAKFLEA